MLHAKPGSCTIVHVISFVEQVVISLKISIKFPLRTSQSQKVAPLVFLFRAARGPKHYSLIKFSVVCSSFWP